MRKYLLFGMLLMSCMHQPFLSVPLNSGRDLLFAEFREPVAGWPYGFSGQVYMEAEKPFALAVTEVPYSLWYTVRLWAQKELGYQFGNLGAEGSHGQPGALPSIQRNEYRQLRRWPNQRHRYGVPEQPVSQVSWGAAVVWCNALSEYLNWLSAETPWQAVYVGLDGKILRSAERANAGELRRRPAANGFRLPSGREWEMAGRWLNGRKWLAADRAAGARNDYSSPWASSQVAWYAGNSRAKSWPVASRWPTARGLYDMSGNLAEWVEDFFQPHKETVAVLPFRTIRGGAYLSPARELQVAGRLPALPQQAHSSIGFRLAFNLAAFHVGFRV